MKRITLFTILLLVLAFSCFAATDLALAPVKGMMRTHYLLSTDNMYKHLINGNAIGTNSDVVDNAAVALCSIKSTGKNSDDKDCVSLKIEYDGVFASDENPSIVRPYYIYMVEKSWRGNAQSNYDKEKSRLLNTTENPSGDNRSFPSQTAIDNNGGGDYLWLDFVLQFPGERGVDGGGVTVDGTYYPLVEGRYSSEVTITATMKSGDTQTITIPLMAIHDTENQGVVDSQVSMNVSPNANAVNLNLDNMLATGTPVSIGKLSFLIRSSVDAVLNSSESDKDLSPNYKIFLSASSDPFYQDRNGFMFVHQDFREGIDSYNESNSVNFYVQVNGSGETSDRSATYDGTSYSDSEGNIKNGTALIPKCNKVQVLNEGSAAHFHTYEGTLSIYVDSNPNLLLNAGRYRGDIYVHVISY